LPIVVVIFRICGVTGAVRACGAAVSIIVVVVTTRHFCSNARDMALVVYVNPDAFGGGDGEEVAIKRLVGEFVETSLRGS
jgi:hypothetical protein